MHLVYFVADGARRHFKVGTTADIQRRMRELQTAQAGALHLLGTVAGSYAVERHVHQLLAPWAAGGEWFSLTGPTNRFIADSLAFGLDYAERRLAADLDRRSAKHEFSASIAARISCARAGAAPGQTETIPLLASRDELKATLRAAGFSKRRAQQISDGGWESYRDDVAPMSEFDRIRAVIEQNASEMRSAIVSAFQEMRTS